MSGSNEPTARQGIRAAKSTIGAAAAAVEQQRGEFLQANADAQIPRSQGPAPETTLVNTTTTPSAVDPLQSTSFAEGGLQFENGVLTVTDPERQSTILEALHAHRAILHGLLARKTNESSLNPASREHEIGAISRGIARAEQVIRELSPEGEQAFTQPG